MKSQRLAEHSWLALALLAGCDGGPSRGSPVPAPAPSASATEAHTGGAAAGSSADGTPGGGGTSSTGGVGFQTAEVEPPLTPTPDCHWPDPITPRCDAGYCRIEPGCFIMGAPRSEFQAAKHADVQVQVTLTHAFELGQTELTRGEWLATGWELPLQVGAATSQEQCFEDDCPIGNVSFFDVVAFANHLSSLRGLSPCYELADCTGEVGDGLTCTSILLTADALFDCEGYRLPAEAEWEYAARAGTSTAFFTGDITPQKDIDCCEDPALEPIGWYCTNSGNRVQRVAQKQPNPWGLYDTAGNSLEWINDHFAPEGYGEGPLVDYQGAYLTGRELIVDSRTFRVMRGGEIKMPPYFAKVNARLSIFDWEYAASFSVRLARTLDLPSSTKNP